MINIILRMILIFQAAKCTIFNIIENVFFSIVGLIFFNIGSSGQLEFVLTCAERGSFALVSGILRRMRGKTVLALVQKGAMMGSATEWGGEP